MANGEAEEYAEIKTALGSVALKGKRIAEIISILCLALLLVLTSFWWMHHEQTAKFETQVIMTLKEVSGANTAVTKELTSAMRDGAAAQKEQNCLLRFVQADRQANADFCRQMGTAR